MIRHIIVPREKEFVIRFPEEMIGKPTEILVFSIDEEGSPEAIEEAEDPAPDRDTFLSYLQSSGFAAQGLRHAGGNTDGSEATSEM